jgi:acyl dehydratase
MRVMSDLLRDPNPIHLDRDATRRLGLGDRLVNPGPINMGHLMEMLGRAGVVRRLTLRHLGTVREGDLLVAAGLVRSLETVAGERRATCDVWLDRDDGERLLAGTAVLALGDD